jgi:hypothetical protein
MIKNFMRMMYWLQCYLEQSTQILRLLELETRIKVEECDVAVDVGGSYDFENLKFDHHQEGNGWKACQWNRILRSWVSLETLGALKSVREKVDLF